MSTTFQATTNHGAATGTSAALLAMKAAFSTLVQRRNGARESARVLYYRTHSLLRALRQHLRGAA